MVEDIIFELLASSRKAVASYTEASDQLNTLLKGKQPLIPHMHKKVHHLDEATNKHVSKGHVVYRGIPVHHSQFKKGKTYHHSGYTSTSKDEDTAKSFAGGAESSVLHLKVPAGFRYHDVERVHPTGENEHLLPRGTRFSVDHVLEGKNGEPAKVFGTIHSKTHPHEVKKVEHLGQPHETALHETKTHRLSSLNTPAAKLHHNFHHKDSTNYYEIRHKKSGKSSYVGVRGKHAYYMDEYGKTKQKAHPIAKHIPILNEEHRKKLFERY